MSPKPAADPRAQTLLRRNEAMHDERVRGLGFESWHDAITRTTNMKIIDAARATGVDRGSISRWRERYGIEPEPMRLPSGYTSVSQVIRETPKASTTDVARALGMHTSTVRIRRSAAGITAPKNRTLTRTEQHTKPELNARRLGYLSFEHAMHAMAGMPSSEVANLLGVRTSTINRHRAAGTGVADPEDLVTERMDRQARDAGYLSWRDAIRTTHADPVEKVAAALHVSVAKVQTWRPRAYPTSSNERSVLATQVLRELISLGWTVAAVVERSGIHFRILYSLTSDSPPDQVRAGTALLLDSLRWCPLPRPAKYRMPGEVRVSVEEVAPQIKQMCAHLSQLALSRQIGIKQSRISAILSGQVRTLASHERDRVHEVYARGEWRQEGLR